MHLKDTPTKIRKTHNIGLFTIGAILVILKLCNAIDISWWLVLLPMYITPLILIIILILALLVVRNDR